MNGNATDTTDNATNAADNATDAASPQRQLHATEQSSASAEPEPTGLQASPQTGATEHSLAPLVLLAAADKSTMPSLVFIGASSGEEHGIEADLLDTVILVIPPCIELKRSFFHPGD